MCAIQSLWSLSLMSVSTPDMKIGLVTPMGMYSSCLYNLFSFNLLFLEFYTLSYITPPYLNYSKPQFSVYGELGKELVWLIGYIGHEGEGGGP